jgi:hypothetical protein
MELSALPVVHLYERWVTDHLFDPPAGLGARDWQSVSLLDVIRRAAPGRRGRLPPAALPSRAARSEPRSLIASDQEPNTLMTRRVVGRGFPVGAPAAAFSREDGRRFHSLADGGSPSAAPTPGSQRRSDSRPTRLATPAAPYLSSSRRHRSPLAEPTAREILAYGRKAASLAPGVFVPHSRPLRAPRATRTRPLRSASDSRAELPAGPSALTHGRTARASAEGAWW